MTSYDIIDENRKLVGYKGHFEARNTFTFFSDEVNKTKLHPPITVDGEFRW